MFTSSSHLPADYLAAANHPSFPNFFIVGAMKAATTTLHAWLKQHPDIFLTEEKEPFYFIDGFPHREDGSLLKRPWGGKRVFPAHFSSHSFNTPEKYLRLFKGAHKYPIRGEASTLYLPHPPAAARIRECSPNAKILILLRNPIDRAHSAFNFQRSLGLEPCETFRDALEEELSGQREDWWYGFRYLYTSMYHDQVKRFLGLFGANNVLILRQEDMRDDPANLLRCIFSFLSVSDYEPRALNSTNVTKLRSPLVTAIYRSYRHNRAKNAIASLLPLKLRKSLGRIVRHQMEKLGTHPGPLDEADRELLRSYFSKDLKNLAQLTGWDLSNWSAQE